jgi:hypothetical protein
MSAGPRCAASTSGFEWQVVVPVPKERPGRRPNLSGESASAIHDPAPVRVRVPDSAPARPLVRKRGPEPPRESETCWLAAQRPAELVFEGNRRPRAPRGDVAAVLVKAAVVGSVDPFGGGEIDDVEGAPRCVCFDHLGLLRAVDRLVEGVDPLELSSGVRAAVPAVRRSRRRGPQLAGQQSLWTADGLGLGLALGRQAGDLGLGLFAVMQRTMTSRLG